MQQRQIRLSKAIQKRTGRTFHLATRLLPRRARYPTYVLYAFFRIADEVVDDADGTPAAEQAARLEEIRAQALGRVEPREPVLAAFRELADEYGIGDDEIDYFIDAMKSDIETERYETFEALREYMRGSAAAVGVMMTAVMDPEEAERALPHAVALGEAFQLTNFVRDVREDIVERDRIYLPEETLDVHGVAPEQIEELRFSPAVADAVEAELRRAESLYREGVAGIKYLPEDCRFGVLLAAVLYADHHRAIRDRGNDVLGATPELGTVRKLSLLVRTRARWTMTKNPEAVFRSVIGFDGRGPAPSRHDGRLPVPTR